MALNKILPLCFFVATALVLGSCAGTSPERGGFIEMSVGGGLSGGGADTRGVKEVPRHATVAIDTACGLTTYYPAFDRIDLVCGKMPSQSETDIIFCAEAAFTHKLLDHFSHENIDGDHVSFGVRYSGAQCRDNSGAFAFFDGTWQFVRGDYSALLDVAASRGGMAFGQAIIIHNGCRVTPLWRGGVHEFRALCEKNGMLCVADSTGPVDYSEFVDRLEKYGVDHALYLDMGAGWNHSWWRDASGEVHEIHPPDLKSMFCTNWIAFRKP